MEPWNTFVYPKHLGPIGLGQSLDVRKEKGHLLLTLWVNAPLKFIKSVLRILKSHVSQNGIKSVDFVNIYLTLAQFGDKVSGNYLWSIL